MSSFNILHIIIGFIGLIVIALPFSENAKIINYKYILYGILSQVILALLLLKVSFIVNIFEILGNAVVILQEATTEGANFVFGYAPSEGAPVYRSLLETFAFGVLPYIIVMSCISAILWYWGILPFLVNILSKVCQKLFNIGGPVGLGAAAVYGPSVAAGVGMFANNPVVQAPFKIAAAAASGPTLASLAM
mgnify:CR=1 FL=1